MSSAIIKVANATVLAISIFPLVRYNINIKAVIVLPPIKEPDIRILVPNPLEKYFHCLLEEVYS